jgi:iron donor protein CyaY
MASEFRDDSEFRHAVSDVLGALTAQVDVLDEDAIDARLIPGSLEVVFEDAGGTFVLSQQTPTHELWLSANLRAWHFRRVGGQWVERDTTEPMLGLLGRLFSEKLGRPVHFEL